MVTSNTTPKSFKPQPLLKLLLPYADESQLARARDIGIDAKTLSQIEARRKKQNSLVAENLQPLLEVLLHLPDVPESTMALSLGIDAKILTRIASGRKKVNRKIAKELAKFTSFDYNGVRRMLRQLHVLDYDWPYGPEIHETPEAALSR